METRLEFSNCQWALASNTLMLTLKFTTRHSIRSLCLWHCFLLIVPIERMSSHCTYRSSELSCGSAGQTHPTPPQASRAHWLFFYFIYLFYFSVHLFHGQIETGRFYNTTEEESLLSYLVDFKTNVYTFLFFLHKPINHRLPNRGSELRKLNRHELRWKRQSAAHIHESDSQPPTPCRCHCRHWPPPAAWQHLKSPQPGWHLRWGGASGPATSPIPLRSDSSLPATGFISLFRLQSCSIWPRAATLNSHFPIQTAGHVYSSLLFVGKSLAQLHFVLTETQLSFKDFAVQSNNTAQPAVSWHNLNFHSISSFCSYWPLCKHLLSIICWT